jgi:hypothetical protein
LIIRAESIIFAEVKEDLTNEKEDSVMKKKTFLATVFAFMAASFMAVGETRADFQWYECSIVGVITSNTGAAEVRLQPINKPKNRAFTLPAAEINKMLSIILTAMSLDYNVFVEIDWSKVESTDVQQMMLLAPSPQ